MTSTHHVEEGSISVFTTTETQLTGIDLSDLKAKYAASVQGIDYWLKEFELQLKTANERFIKIIEDKKIYFERIFSEIKKNNHELELLLQEIQNSRDSKTDLVEKLQKRVFELTDQFKEKSNVLDQAKEVLKKEKETQLLKFKELEAIQKEKMAELDKLKRELYEFSVKINERQLENQQFQAKKDTQHSTHQENEELLERQQKKEIHNISQEIHDLQEENKDRQKRRKLVETKEKEFQRMRDTFMNEEDSFRKATTTILSSWKSRNPSLTGKQNSATQEREQLEKTVTHYTKLVRDQEDKLRQRETAHSAEQEELNRRYVGFTDTLRIYDERFETVRRKFEEIRKKRDLTLERLVSTRDAVSPVRVILDNVRESVFQKSKNISSVSEEFRDRSLEVNTLDSSIKLFKNEKNQFLSRAQHSLEEVSPFRKQKDLMEFDIVELSSEFKKNKKEITKKNESIEKMQKQIKSIGDKIGSTQGNETVLEAIEKVKEKSEKLEIHFKKEKSSAEKELQRFLQEIRKIDDEIRKKETEFSKIQTELEKKDYQLNEANGKISIFTENSRQLDINHQTELRNRIENITTISKKREISETTLKELQTQQSRVRTQHRQYREQRETTARELEKVRTESKQIRTDRETVVTVRRRTVEETKGFAVRVKDVQAELVDLKQEVESKDELIKEVHQKEKILRLEVEECWSKVQELNTHVANKTSQIEQVISEILELAPRQKRKLEEAKKEIFILKASINKRTQQHNEAWQQLTEINNSLQTLNLKLEETLKELELYNMDKEKERFSEIRGKLSIAKKEIEALRTDIEMMTSQYQEKIKLLDVSGARVEKLTNERISINGNLDPIKAECLKLKEVQKNLLEEQRKTEIERDNISAELEKLRKEKSRYQIEFQEVEKKLKIETEKAEKSFSQFRTSQSELSTAKVDLDTAVENLRTSETQIRKLESLDKTAKRNLEEETSALAALRRDLTLTTGNLDDTRNSLTSVEEKYFTRERNYATLESERKNTKKEIFEIQSKGKEIRREISEGEDEKKIVEENFSENEKKNSAAKEETRSIEKRVQELGMEIERYKEELDNTNLLKSTLLNKMDSIDLQDYFHDLSNTREDLDNWKNRYHQKNGDYDDLTNNTNRENQSHQDTVKKITILRKNISEVTSAEKDLKNSGNRLRSELKKNQSEWEHLKKELFSAKSEVEILSRRYESSRTALERKDMEKNSLLSKISSLSLQVEVLKKERLIEASRAQALSIEASALGTQVDAQLGRIEALQSELQELETLRTEIENLNSSLSTLKTTHRLLQTAAEVTSPTSTETDQLTQTRTELLSRAESLRDETEAVTLELKTLDDSLKALREQRKVDRERIRDMERRERDLAVERETQRRLVVELELQLTELEAFRGEFDASVVTRREVKEEYVRIEKKVHGWEEEDKVVESTKELNESTRQKLTKLSHQKKILTEETQTIRTRMTTLEHRMDSLLKEREAQVARLEALKADLTAIKSERDVNLVWMDTEHRRIQQALGGLRLHLTNRHSDLLDLLSHLQVEYTMVKSQLLEIEERRNSKKKDFTDLCTNNENTQLELGKMRRKMGQLQTTLEEYKMYIVKAEAKIQELVKVEGKIPPKEEEQNSPEKDTGSEKGNDPSSTEKGTTLAGKRAHQDEYMDVDEDSPKFGSGTPSVKRPRLRIRLPPNTPHLPTQVVPQDWAYEGSDSSDRR